MKKDKFWNKLLVFINTVLAILLLLSYSLPYISPKSSPGFTIVSLTIPLLFLLNIFFVIYWIVRLKIYFLLSFIIIIIGFSYLNSFYKFSGKKNFLNDDIKVMNSSDGGANWNKPLKLHTDNTKTEHGFVSTINYNNDFLSTYLDGRQNELAKHDKGVKPQMTLRSTSYNVDGEILMDKLIDDRVCDCCQTDLGITKSNIPITVYRDRSENETRDIYYSFFKDSNWSIPAVVNNDKWIISGCPVNGPAISTFKNSSSVVWYTEEEGESKLKIAFSENIINGFDDPILINANDPLGRVDIEMISETSSLISYMDIVDEKAYIKVQKINSITGNNKFIIIEEISNTRASGFPKINIIDNDKTIITWTDAQNKYNVKTMLLNNSYFD